MYNWPDIVTAVATFGTFLAVGAAFFISHRPMLSVSIKNCEYSAPDKLFKGHIQIRNHGTAIADRVALTFTFGGTNDRKKIDRIVIQPGDKHADTLSLPIMPDNALIQGSYKGIIIRYPYNARLNYDPNLKRFVPSIAW